MRTLLLVKHSLPEVLPGVPAERWRLGEEGRRRCKPLAARLAPYEPTVIVASAEPKATETAVLVANELHRPVETVEGLHEHDRGNEPYFPTTAEWEAAVATFFARPEELVLGRETAVEARDRFARAVAEVLAKYPALPLLATARPALLRRPVPSEPHALDDSPHPHPRLSRIGARRRWPRGTAATARPKRSKLAGSRRRA